MTQNGTPSPARRALDFDAMLAEGLGTVRFKGKEHIILPISSRAVKLHAGAREGGGAADSTEALAQAASLCLKPTVSVEELLDLPMAFLLEIISIAGISLDAVNRAMAAGAEGNEPQPETPSTPAPATPSAS